jgi:transcription elongation factor Elf1
VKHLILAGLLILISFGCHKISQPKVFDCSECGGDGRVYYGPGHPIVKMGFDVGEYDCPMCGGSGELQIENH